MQTVEECFKFYSFCGARKLLCTESLFKVNQAVLNSKNDCAEYISSSGINVIIRGGDFRHGKASV